jgi:hypothetical protein
VNPPEPPELVKPPFAPLPLPPFAPEPPSSLKPLDAEELPHPAFEPTPTKMHPAMTAPSGN